MNDLGKQLSAKEMACRCCGDLRVDDRLLAALETLQNLAGEVVEVDDVYRCSAHNQEVDGISDGEHTSGTAAHIRIPGFTLQQMYELALKVPEFADGGIGAYDGGFLHVDVRRGSSRWAHVRGQYVGIQHLVQEPAQPVSHRRAAHASAAAAL